MRRRYKWETPESNRGYLAMGQERLDGGLPDLKETFEIGNEAETTSATRGPRGLVAPRGEAPRLPGTPPLRPEKRPPPRVAPAARTPPRA